MTSARGAIFLTPVFVKPSPPGLAGGASLRRGEEVFERDVKEGPARLGEDLLAVAKVGIDVDAPPAAVRHPAASASSWLMKTGRR